MSKQHLQYSLDNDQLGVYSKEISWSSDQMMSGSLSTGYSYAKQLHTEKDVMTAAVQNSLGHQLTLSEDSDEEFEFLSS
jgi:hypothetical protein